MDYKLLGNADLKISRLGLGTWAFGGDEFFGWSGQDKEDSVATVLTAVDAGINWLDTAPIYGLGLSEEVIGVALKKIPQNERPLIFTKCGLLWEKKSGQETDVRASLTPQSIRRELEDSLSRLGVETIDLYQIHTPPEDGSSLEDAWSTMLDLVTEGKVRYAGVSNFSVAQLEQCSKIGPINSVQPELSLIKREAGEEVIPWCGENGTGVITYSPLYSGMLTGGVTRERLASLDDSDWRKNAKQFTGENLDRNLAFVEFFLEHATEIGVSPSELALRWVLSWKPVTGAIVGARRPSQLKGWANSSLEPLSSDTLSLISEKLSVTGAGIGTPTRP
ncbi:MAG: aldo/keto reductase [Microbacteriaceae bacterium]|nr:aldo/keto reductase [Microbacteriaceae bacterium]